MTTREEGAVPDFLRMDEASGSAAANAGLTGDWYGWPSKDVTPVTLLDDEGADCPHPNASDGPGGAHHAHSLALHRAALWTFRR